MHTEKNYLILLGMTVGAGIIIFNYYSVALKLIKKVSRNESAWNYLRVSSPNYQLVFG